MEKKGLFTGWKDVFSFTAAQSIKGSSYKATTIILGIVVALIFALISIVMALLQDGDDSDFSDEDKAGIIEIADTVENVYVSDNEVMGDETLNALIMETAKMEGFLGDESFNVTVLPEDEIYKRLNESEGNIAIEVTYTDNDTYLITVATGVLTDISDDMAQDYASYFITYTDIYKSQLLSAIGDEATIEFIMAPYRTQSHEASEDVHSVGVMITEMVVPMLFSLIIYMMIILYGQNVTKIVVAEKSSKLMEMMLTSVKPYALIAGKILAVSALAILQMSVWICFGIIGYNAGKWVASAVNPGYVNYVDNIIELMSVEAAGSAFSTGAVVIAILTMVTGFFMFSCLAGLVAASVSKMEELSSAMGIFQIPVIIGWLAAYFTALIENKSIVTLIHILPVTSPFVLPADVVIGKATLAEGAVSLGVLVLTTFVIILLTGKIYKGKLFNRR